jgi:putative restriction endonuclease
MKDRKYEEQRLHKDPHYFGFAVIGNVSLDPESSKGDLYADVEFFEMFDEAVLAKQNDEYIEQIPESKASNYWRNGVRPITFETYTKLRELSDTTDETEFTPITTEVAHPELFLEGTTRQVSVNGYERNRKARTRCLEIHGTSCLVCDVDLESIYGQVAQGFIHVHHNKELSEIGEEYEVDPEQDLSPVCPNCHAIIHRRKPSYSIDEVRGMLNRHS